MPFGMGPIGPSWEIIIIESIYVMIVTLLSFAIYFKTSELYALSKHTGIYHFRNIFLYFGLAYIFRIWHVVSLFYGQNMHYRMHVLMPVEYMFVSYFSTLAILSIVASIFGKQFNKQEHITTIMHIAAFLATAITLLSYSPLLLISVQTTVFIIALIIALLESTIDLKKNHKIIFILLFIFWVVSTLSFAKGYLLREIKIPLYLISIGLFFSIFQRVRAVYAKA